jgi:hypothetical protein
MAIASAPTVVNGTQSLVVWAGRGPSAPDQRPARNLQHVGTVLVAPGDNSTVPLGGFFDCWYDKVNHNFLIDITSAQVGGPV